MVVAYIVFWRAAPCYILTPQVGMIHLSVSLSEFGYHSILAIPICAVTLHYGFSYHSLMVTDNGKQHFTCSFASIHHIHGNVPSCPVSIF